MNRFLSFVAAMLSVPLLAQAPPEAERILFPVFTPPVHGAFGSEFHTDLRIANTGEETVFLYGLISNCTICLPPANNTFPLAAGAEVGTAELNPLGTPGRFIYATREAISFLSMNLRVHDVTREALSFGTEIPIVRQDDFVINRIVFVGVPTDARFRNALRVYAPFPVDVLVTVGNQATVRLTLTPGISMFDPAYGIFTAFPIGAAPVRVTVEADPDIVTLLPIETPLWAFITVTNNDTQAISTITPQP